MHQQPTGDPLDLFLGQVGKVALLTSPEEIRLAKRIERGDDRVEDRDGLPGDELDVREVAQQWHRPRGVQSTKMAGLRHACDP